MPELPEVETIARDLRGLVTGAQIDGARSNWPATLRSHDAAAFAGDVAGREIEGVGRRGKQLLIWLAPKAGSAAGSAAAPGAPAVHGPAVLTVHLKMTGQLFVVPAETPQDRHVHLALVLSDGREIRFRDIRKFGRIGLYPRDPATGLPLEGEAVGVLAAGAEPLADEFTARRFGEMLARRRGRIKTLLMNQEFLAGVGNIYADEALWRARIHPLRDAHTLRPDDARRLHAALRDVLAEAVERRGSSVDDYTAPDGDGSMQEHLTVYQRAGEPCLRCGRPIRRIVVGGRSTHFCGWCQRLPAAPRGSAGPTQTRGRGPRWTELSGVGVLGRTAGEEAAVLARAEERRRRTAAKRVAAASRRAAARAGDHHGSLRGRARLMSIVRLEGLVREVGDFVILDRVDAAIAAGDRIGLVGPNGAGKTTLLRLLAGVDEPDGGTIHRKRGMTMAMLSQEAHVDAAFIGAPSLRQAVRTGAGRLEELERTLRQLEMDGRVTEPEYERLQHEFAVKDGYSLDQRVESALSGLGFARDDWDRPPTNLSGGEQTRAALARLLLSDPELLMLDEPTNHLDLGALEWLEEHLGRRHGALLVASHDRAFLDATVTRIWELRDRRLTPFRGGYSAFARQREERDIREAEEAGDRAAQIAREKELIQLYRHQRKHTKMHEHEARLEALEPIEKRRSEARLRLPTEALAGGSAARSYESVVRAEGLVVGYRSSATTPGRAVRTTPTETPVARVPWLELRRGDRVGIVGPNGAGKTTLLRTIAGELQPLDGGLDLGRNVQLTYLAQLRDAPIPGTTVLDALLTEMPLTAAAARGHLARFLFRGDEVMKEVTALSGGERSRLELALLFLLPANLLLLDEPTNHLDIPAREALESFMAGTEATLLIVSHDRRLLEKACDSLWVVDDGLAVPFDGGYRAWRAAVADGWTVKAAAEREAARLHGGRKQEPAGRSQGRAVVDSSSKTHGRGAGSAVSSSGSGRTATAEVAAPAPRTLAVKLSKDAYRRRKAQIDEELTRLNARKLVLESALGDPGVHGNFVELRRVTGELAALDEALAAAEEAWLEMEEAAP